MPAIDSGKVLVSGASGYIAVWIVKVLLDRGFFVRGTVRSQTKGSRLRDLFKSYGDQFEYVVVEDIARVGAFDDAVKNVDAIAHTASPFHTRAVEPDELILPAVQGTTGLLKSAQRYGNQLKRVLLTSSCAAIHKPSHTGSPRVADETIWNEVSVQEVREMGKDAPSLEKYRASKTLAERAAWNWYSENKTKLKWDMVALNPSFVIGPWLHRAERVENLNHSLYAYHSIVLKGRMSDDLLATTGASWVDVRDVAFAHLLALLTPAAGGERIIISSTAFKWQDLIVIARRLGGDKLPAGNISYDPSQAVHVVEYSTEKSERILGMRYRSLVETTQHTLHEFKCRGWHLL